MNETPDLQKNETRAVYTMTDTPWYFGAYLNQARHNLFLTINEIALRIGETAIEHDDKLLSSKAVLLLNSSKENDLLKKEAAMKLYEKYLPFLFRMQCGIESVRSGRAEASIVPSASIYYELLKILIDSVNNFRNIYSHYHGLDKKSPEGDLLVALRAVFDHNIKLVQQRFSLKDDDVIHLKRPYSKKKEDRYYYCFEQDGAFTQAGLAFFICLLLTREEAFHFLKKLKGFKRGEERSHKATLETFCVGGLNVPKERLESNSSPQAVFLDMCNELAKCPSALFHLLSPEQQELFRRNAEEEDEAEELKGETLEVEKPASLLVRKENRFTFFALRYLDITKALPHTRFGVDLGTYHYSIYPKTIAGIEEKRRLSKRLIGYGRLEDFDKKCQPSEFSSLCKAPEDVTEDNMEPYIRSATPHYHLECNNVLLHRTSRTAVHWPSINTLEVEGKSYTHRLDKKDTLVPFAVLSVKELPALLLYQLLRKDIGKGLDVEGVMMQHRENINKFFNDVLHKRIKPVAQQPFRKPVANVIVSRSNMEYNKRFSELEKILSGYHLPISSVPENLIDYLLNITPVNWKEKATTQLQNMLAEAKELLWSIKRDEKSSIDAQKPIKKIQVGKLAQKLAEDMLLMQPVGLDGSGNPAPSSKANNLHFRILQSHLAYFAEYEGNLQSVFNACNLTNALNSHPFLDKVPIRGCRSVLDFFDAYFQEKIVFLDKCLKEQNWDSYHFLKFRQEKKHIDHFLKRYMNQASNDRNEGDVPMNLPAGLFLNAAVQLLKEHGNESQKKMLTEKQQVNSVYLIRKLFQQSGVQPFYEWPRGYRLFDKDNIPLYIDEAKRKSDVKLFAQKMDNARATLKLPHSNGGSQLKKEQKVAKRFIENYKFYLDSEKLLRLVVAQDILLFKCIQDLLVHHIGDIGLEDKAGGAAGTFNLSTISPLMNEGDKSLLNSRPSGGVVLDKVFYQTNAQGAFVKRDGKKVQAGSAIILDNTLKIKNAGNFRKLLKDRRINNLCFYFNPNQEGKITLHRMVLINELRDYDRMRLQVLPVIAAFEKLLFENCIEEEKCLLKLEGNYHHRRFLDRFCSKYGGDIDDARFEWMARVRNAFLHNQFPLLENWPGKLSAAQWESINTNYRVAEVGSTKGYGLIEPIAEYAISQYEELISKIK